jgi:DNA replication protein DnaC
MTLISDRIPPGVPMGKSPIPARFRQFTELADIEHDGLRELTRRYLKDFWDLAGQGRGPLLIGKTGHYKTISAAVIAHKVREVGRLQVGWCNCVSDLSRLASGSFADASKAIRHFETVSFLVMDDFAQPKPGGREMTWILQIANARFDAVRPTLWTGNVTPTALDSVVGVGTARRLLESAKDFRVAL